MACGDKKASFRVAILDPALTVTQPPRVTALTGIDAVSHALESWVTTRRNPASLAFAREAWRLLAGNFLSVLTEPENLDARGAMQLGASFAGMAIENSMLGATHALANPLTTAYGIPHGQAIAVMLPHVVGFNGEQYRNWYLDLLAGGNGDTVLPGTGGDVSGLVGFIDELVAKAGLEKKLAALGVERARLPELAAEAAKQWTSRFNPRKVAEAELLALYEAAF
jgi:alcohol dehydrogenase